jgi:hypothetical protein
VERERKAEKKGEEEKAIKSDSANFFMDATLK